MITPDLDKAEIMTERKPKISAMLILNPFLVKNSTIFTDFLELSTNSRLKKIK